MVLMNKYFCLLYMLFGLIQTYVSWHLANITVWKMLLFPFCKEEANKQTFLVVLHFLNYSLIHSCTHTLLEPPTKDNSITFCSVEYATKVSISVALCLLGPEMFSTNIYFRHLVVVTIQLKLNISSPSKQWRQIGKCRYSPTQSQPQHYMEARGPLQSLQMEHHFL